MEVSLYIHIPFCKSKCHYCDFFSISKAAKLIPEYIDALAQEIKIYSEKYNFKIKTIYIGGGTPSILNPENIKSIILNVREYFYLKSDLEFTIEANPESINADFLETIVNCGINRLSIGVQTFNDKLLKFAGRLASQKIIDEKLNLIKKIKFKNWSADLIYGLPYQKLKDFENDLKKLISYNPFHISLYSLTIENGTKFFSLYERKKEIFPSDDEIADMYLLANEYLEKNNYHRYEISNFAKKSFECKHNLAYWNQENYLGLGPSAVSTIQNIRWKNVPDVNGYIKNLKNKKVPILEKTKLTKKEKIQEFIMLQLRLRKGLNLDLLKQKYKIDLFKIRNQEIKKFIEAELLKIKGKNLFLTLKGIMISNSIISELI